MRTAWHCIFSLLLLASGATSAAPESLSALCPKAKGDEIIVCASPDPPQSRYRLPLRSSVPEFGTRASASVSAERNGLFDYDVGGAAGQCSNIGPAGSYGCEYKAFKRGVSQRADARDPRGRVYNAPGN